MKQVAHATLSWLADQHWRTDEEMQLAAVAGDLCRALSCAPKTGRRVGHLLLLAPTADTLSMLPRTELLEWCSTSKNSRRAGFAATYSREEAAQMLGSLALSYANSYDLPVVSAVIRKAAFHFVTGRKLLQACTFLCEQQQPGGCFGFFTGLDADTKGRASQADHRVSLRITVDALSALASYRLADPFAFARTVGGLQVHSKRRGFP